MWPVAGPELLGTCDAVSCKGSNQQLTFHWRPSLGQAYTKETAPVSALSHFQKRCAAAYEKDPLFKDESNLKLLSFLIGSRCIVIILITRINLSHIFFRVVIRSIIDW
ncbi:MAG: hypothetical protein FRX49_07845 [Trebouxia sp. A1-2]|nr:MAG: hypothetical protein FRX49_07845 [Trebouxia sp. A1-2]